MSISQIFLIIQAAALLITAAMLFSLFIRFRHFFRAVYAAAGRPGSDETEKTGVSDKTKKQPGRSVFRPFLPSVLLPLAFTAVLIFLTVRDPINGVIILIHLTVFWLVADTGLLAASLIRRAAGRSRTDLRLAEHSPGIHMEQHTQRRRSSRAHRRILAGILALSVNAVYLGYGWYTAHHVIVTDYALQTCKFEEGETLRIVQLSDSHIGATFDGDGFAAHMETVRALKPDLVVVTGDFVDDDTTAEDMRKGCEALGTLDAPLGVFFVFGNHDEGYYLYRAFTSQELREQLQLSGVVILEDEHVMVTDDVCLIGRRDRSARNRLPMTDLMQDIPQDCYTIVLDHQPHNFEAQARAGADLVLCGHTHGGQMFPIGITGEMTGANDKTYGLEIRENTDFIVNSGISDWAIKFKTGGAVAEIGLITVSSGS